MPIPLRVLVVEDEAVSRESLCAALRDLGHDVIAAVDGVEAWARYRSDPDVNVVISDWMMPEMDGLDLCRHIRGEEKTTYTYVILLTVKSGRGSYLEGMNASADDFVTKPFDRDELAARLRVAGRIVTLHREVSQLKSLLPICAYCKKIREPDDKWVPFEAYIARHTSIDLSHSICPECYNTTVMRELEEFDRSSPNPDPDEGSKAPG